MSRRHRLERREKREPFNWADWYREHIGLTRVHVWRIISIARFLREYPRFACAKWASLSELMLMRPRIQAFLTAPGNEAERQYWSSETAAEAATEA